MLALAPFADRLADTPLQVQMYGEYSRWLVVAMVLWVLGSKRGAMVVARRESKSIAVTVLALSSLLAVQVGVSGHNTIRARTFQLYHGRGDQTADQAGRAVLFRVLLEQTLPFYLKRTFTLVDFKDEMDSASSRTRR